MRAAKGGQGGSEGFTSLLTQPALQVAVWRGLTTIVSEKVSECAQPSVPFGCSGGDEVDGRPLLTPRENDRETTLLVSGRSVKSCRYELTL